MDGFRRRGEAEGVNIVYVLNRNGRVEPPHLIQIHHFNNNGVRLRDVKRWLVERRGKDMPDSFVWSCKRRCKGGYTWQDLTDCDMIAPISDNKYILKGSLIQTSFLHDTISCGEIECQKTEPEPKPDPETTGSEKEGSPKNSPHLARNSPVPEPSKPDRRNAIFRTDLSAEKEKGETNSRRTSVGCSSRASHVLRSMLTCGETDTVNSALLPVTCRCGGPHRRRASSLRGGPTQPGQPRRSSGAASEDNDHPFRKSRSRSDGKSEKGAVPAVYKRVGAPIPNCSQCGKGFNPKKLHSHMKSCRGLKMRGKGTIGLDRIPQTSDSHSQEFSRESIAGFLTA